MSNGHPRLATWILTRCAPDYRGDSFIGDLLEQYETRGSCWYWRQALGALRACSVRRLLSANDTTVLTADYVGDLVTAVTLILFGFNQVGFFAGLFLHSSRWLHSRSNHAVAESALGAAFLASVVVVHLIRTRSAATRLRELGSGHLT